MSFKIIDEGELSGGSEHAPPLILPPLEVEAFNAIDLEYPMPAWTLIFKVKLQYGVAYSRRINHRKSGRIDNQTLLAPQPFII